MPYSFSFIFSCLAALSQSSQAVLSRSLQSMRPCLCLDFEVLHRWEWYKLWVFTRAFDLLKRLPSVLGLRSFYPLRGTFLAKISVSVCELVYADVYGDKRPSSAIHRLIFIYVLKLIYDLTISDTYITHSGHTRISTLNFPYHKILSSFC